jgi:hypothetical protein
MNMDSTQNGGGGSAYGSRTASSLPNGGAYDLSFPPGGIPSLRLPVVVVFYLV